MRSMSADNDKSKATVEVPTQSGLQTRVVLRILMILLVVIGLLWVLYKLTAIILLVILSVFFAYLVAPLVDLVQRPVRIGGREVSIPRAIAIGIVYVGLFFTISFAIYFIVPRLADQFPQFRAQAGEYYKTITAGTERLNQYFKQHRMPESRSEEHTSELQSRENLVCRLLLEKKKEYYDLIVKEWIPRVMYVCTS